MALTEVMTGSRFNNYLHGLEYTLTMQRCQTENYSQNPKVKLYCFSNFICQSGAPLCFTSVCKRNVRSFNFQHEKQNTRVN